MRVERAKKVYVPVTIILEEEQDFETFKEMCLACSNLAAPGDLRKMAGQLYTTLVNMQ